MNRTALVFILLFFTGLVVKSQNPKKIEALERKLDLAKADTQKVNTLFELANQYRNVNGEKTFELGKKIISLSDSLNYTKGKIMGNVTLGMGYYYSMSINEKALKHFQEAYEMAKKINDYDLITESMRGMFYVYFDEKQLDKAEKITEEKVKFNRKKNDQKEIAVYYNNKGVINFYRNNYDTALDFYKKAISIARKEKDTLRLSTMYNNVAKVYKMQKNYPLAIQYLTTSLQLKELLNDAYNVAIDHIDFGEIYMETKKYALAEAHLNEGFKITESHKYLEAKVFALESLLKLYKNTNRFEKALAASEQIINYQDSIYTSQKAQSLALFDAEFSSKQKENELIIQRNEIERQNTTIIILVLFAVAFLTLILILIKINADKNKALKKLDIQNHEIEAQNEEITSINSNLENLIEERTEKIRQQSIELIETNQRTSDYKLMALRSVMNPHFLFNCLNSIQFYIAKNNKEEAINYLSQFSKLIRLILNSSMNKTTSLSDEIKILTLYVSLEQLRFDNFTVNFEIEETLDLEKIQIPSLLLQPYVENAIIHGISSNTDKSGLLTIKIAGNKKLFHCIIEDNGIGRKAANAIKENNKLHRSVGMMLTEERLQLINDQQISVEVTDKEDEDGVATGTKVDIKIAIV